MFEINYLKLDLLDNLIIIINFRVEKYLQANSKSQGFVLDASGNDW